MRKSVLVLGGTGILGAPVVRSLAERDHPVRILARTAEEARQMFGQSTDALEGDSTNRDHVAQALDGCHAVHVSLPTESELEAAASLIGYFDKTEEHGDPAEANALLGAPSTTLGEWIQAQKGES